MELTYHRKGDYLFPNLTIQETEVQIGKYGMLRRTFLKEHKNSLYQSLFLTVCKAWIGSPSPWDCLFRPFLFEFGR